MTKKQKNRDIICSVDGCFSHVYGRGMCSKHWQRMWRNGDLNLRRALNGSRMPWVENSINEETDACIVPPFKPNKQGYFGLYREGDKSPSINAHVYVCEKIHGPKPTSHHEVAHGCGKRGCINKRHLRWATHVENLADMILHGTRSRGEKHPRVKLTEKDVLEIRASISRPVDLAPIYGVSEATIRDIRKRKSWFWLPQASEAA